MATTAFCFAILFICNQVNAYSDRVPQSACEDMIPAGHTSSTPQSSAAPYYVNAYKINQNLTSNETFVVTLGGLIGSNVKFSGFFLQARFLKSWNIIGKWTFYANNTLNNHIGTMKCDNINDSLANAWDSFQNHDYYTNISVNWVSPFTSDSEKNVVFVYE